MKPKLAIHAKDISLYISCVFYSGRIRTLVAMATYSSHRLILSSTANATLCLNFKDLNSTVAKRGSVFIGLMTPDGAIWFRYQRAVLMR